MLLKVRIDHEGYDSCPFDIDSYDLTNFVTSILPTFRGRVNLEVVDPTQADSDASDQ